MTTISVSGVELVRAIKSVVPHVPRDRDNDLVSCVHFHVTTSAELLVSGHGGGTGATAAVPLYAEEWDGELTDFALFKDDAGQLPGVLAPREETVVDIVVTHQVTKLPPEFHPKTGEQLPPKEERRTEVEFVEADKMFGGRRVRLSGLDARDYGPERLWARLRDSVLTATAPVELTTEPDLLGRFRAAVKLYKEDGADFRTTGSNDLYVQIGDRFMGYCSGWSTDRPAEGLAYAHWHPRLEAALDDQPHSDANTDAVHEFAGTLRDLADQGITVEVQHGGTRRTLPLVDGGQS